MNCQEIRGLLSSYIDDVIEYEMKEKIQNHLEKCESCKQEYEDLVTVTKILADVSMVQLPEDFREELHSKLIECSLETDDSESQEIIHFKTKLKKFKKNMFNWKTMSWVAATVLIMLISVVGLRNFTQFPIRFSSQNQLNEVLDGEDVNYKMVSEAPAVESRAFTGVNNDQALKTAQIDMTERGVENNFEEQRKLEPSKTNTDREVILSGYMQLDVEDFDIVQEKIVNLTILQGGYIENSHIGFKYYDKQKPEDSLKTGNLIIRIPEELFYDTFNEIKNMGVVINQIINSKDITKDYRDTINEIENLKVREKRLRDIMDKAKNVKEIIEVERELSRVRGEINRYTVNIKKWDNLVSLSTIEIFLNEVDIKDNNIKAIDENIWQKAKRGFIKTTNNMINAIENLFVSFVSLLPILVSLVILAPILIYLYKKFIKTLIKKIFRRE